MRTRGQQPGDSWQQPCCLNTTHKQQNKQDDHDKANGTAWTIAPTLTVIPCGQGTNKNQNKNDENDERE